MAENEISGNLVAKGVPDGKKGQPRSKDWQKLLRKPLEPFTAKQNLVAGRRNPIERKGNTRPTPAET
jgi:hypothetical protein